MRTSPALPWLFTHHQIYGVGSGPWGEHYKVRMDIIGKEGGDAEEQARLFCHEGIWRIETLAHKNISYGRFKGKQRCFTMVGIDVGAAKVPIKHSRVPRSNRLYIQDWEGSFQVWNLQNHPSRKPLSSISIGHSQIPTPHSPCANNEFKFKAKSFEKAYFKRHSKKGLGYEFF